MTTQVKAGKLIIGDVGSFRRQEPHVRGGQRAITGGAGPHRQRKYHGDRCQRVAAGRNPSGSGNISASGSVTRLNVSIDGDGTAQFSGLTARNVDAVVRGSGAIFVTATQSLDAKVQGSGTILHSGNPPQVTTSITGSGAVRPG